MKISLNWVFDHIEGKLSDVDITYLIDTFIKTTAEIETWKKISLNINNFFLAKIIDISSDIVKIYSPENNKSYELPSRLDATINGWYLITFNNGQASWTTLENLGGTKETLLPALDNHAINNTSYDAWKSTIETQDYIIDIDNKSINNRPDLWGHRGLAREISAILNLPFKPLSEFIVNKNILTHLSTIQASEHNPFTISIESTHLCKRFAALYMPSITTRPSQLNMAIRLSRLDSKPIDSLVDITNYVMFDLGQPMHVFDAHALSPSKNISVSSARSQDKLLLLDSQMLELTSEDLIIADDKTPISLAGIMGGASTGVTKHTQSILIESANFDATTIRRSSAQHKKITEASRRFEKSLDPNQNIDALTRFLFLLDAAHIPYESNEYILSLGNYAQEKVITIEHTFIEARLGTLIKTEKIIAILEKICFNVEQSIEDNTLKYIITVPSFRATKDVKIPEDIVEEIGRYIGYDTLPRIMPSLPLHPSNLQKTHTIRSIKRLLSYGLLMRELYSYSFFDESVLHELEWQPTNFVLIENPVSENYTRLVTTLQPHLLKAVGENSAHHTQLRFYEWGRIWYMHDNNIIEQKSLSGIFFDQQQKFDFYEGKFLLSRLFDQLHIDITWSPIKYINFSWHSPYQTASLMHGDKYIGTAGMINEQIINVLSPAGGSGFIFEIDADYLLEYKRPPIRFKPLSKYPFVRRDISMLVPTTMTSDALVKIIQSVDHCIESVTLIDFFNKPEWKDQKAMTFHIEICDQTKTLTQQEIDKIWDRLIKYVQNQGAIIR